MRRRRGKKKTIVKATRRRAESIKEERKRIASEERHKLLMKAWEATVRRAHSLFSPMSVAPADDDSPSPSDESDTDHAEELRKGERLLLNGDFYTGQWSFDGLQHGTGKYLWTDGCMYEGQWRRGTTFGQGKFSWPSGATYEGHFKAGFMDGFGTHTASSGHTYRGSWSMNHKHGHGTKYFSNGDFYDGEWRVDLPDGHGRYIWANGDEYSGEWRAGIIHGKGSFVWAAGERYDGGWEVGRPAGSGTFRWADGSRYIGLWSMDNVDGEAEAEKGIYYPSSAAAHYGPRNPNEFLVDALKDCKISQEETVSIFPSQKSINWSSVKAKPPARKSNARSHAGIGVFGVNGCVCDSDRDGSFDASHGGHGGEEEACSGGRRSSSVDEEHGFVRSQLPVRLRSRKARRQGETISKGHKNYELMLTLQLGIRHAVGKQPGQPITRNLKPSAFDPKEKIWTRFPPEGTKHTPPHQSCDFRWKDYCPLVFRSLRNLFKVDAADYMISICGDDALRELSSPGKSGSFFYLTNDDRYMIKTMKKSEAKVLIRMLKPYYDHVRSYENTLMTRFFGLHSVKLTGSAQKKVRFVIMGNLFCSEYAIHRHFDLKGSSLGRITEKPESEIDETTTLKDLDLNFFFTLHKPWFEEFQSQIEKDCEFLEQERIMDYSLLVGVHFTDDTNNGSYQSPSRLDMDPSDPTRLLSIRLGVNLPSRVERMVRKSGCETQLIGEPTGECYNVVLFFGIIDILQDYDISKKLEHAYKSIQYDPTSISAVDPKQYAKRFRDFICDVFIEDN
ncbi:hypothetical protein HPP92_011750 [Vanilla planifolia]|uniref:Phosphatidylinositol 4-phosphate 5-kinase n=1 Tax=Vanilla planifolia TaxID=51239 RepID=A0A835R187_VANPL|nr:hypothetical protein HPP92_011750 [Vanilla planifolia]